MNLIKTLEKIVYDYGHNFNFYDTDLAIKELGKQAPKGLFGRNMIDIGCGDGTNTKKIKEALKAKTIIGYEVSPTLAKTARDRGLEIVKMNPGDKISGEVGVLWGVVHHFDNPVEEMIGIIKNFESFIIREPIDRWRVFEAGKRYSEAKMTKMVEKVVTKCGKKMTKVIIDKAKSVLYFIE